MSAIDFKALMKAERAPALSSRQCRRPSSAPPPGPRPSAPSLLCAHLSASLSEISSSTVPSTRCIILSGGVDTSAILAASASAGVTYALAVTVSVGPTCPDLPFAVDAASRHGVAHKVVHVSASDLCGSYLPLCARLLGTYDGMTVRNSLVVCAAMRAAAEEGMKDAVVGDAADELFGGYSFCWGMEGDPGGWKDKRDEMCRGWTFATGDIARHYGMKSHSPYEGKGFVEWALESTGREDCVGERQIRLTLDGPTQLHMTGKIVLREAYDTPSSWRRKDPIEVGSGASCVAKDEFWKDALGDDEYEKERRRLDAQGYKITSREVSMEAEQGPHANTQTHAHTYSLA